MQLKGISSFDDATQVDPKLLNEELNRIRKFINTNVEVKVTPNQDNYNTKVKRGQRPYNPYDELPVPTPTPNNPNVPNKPGRPDASMIGASGTTEQAFSFPPISASATLTKDNIGDWVTIGAIPSGYTVRRIYWRTNENSGGVFANANNLLEIKDSDDKILLYQDESDMSIESIGDKPMDHEYTSYNNILAKVYGTASATGAVKITVQLERVVKQQILT